MNGPTVRGIQGAVHRMFELAADRRVVSTWVLGLQSDVDVTDCFRVPVGSADVDV